MAPFRGRCASNRQGTTLIGITTPAGRLALRYSPLTASPETGATLTLPTGTMPKSGKDATGTSRSSPQGEGNPLLTDETLALLLEAIDKTSNGIGIFAPDDRLIYTNSANAELFGLMPALALGKTFSELIRHAYRQQAGINIETDDIDRWLQVALEHRRNRQYRSFQTDTRDGRWLQVTEQLTGGGQMFVFFTDITEQKRVERKLKRLTARLRTHADTDDLTGISNRRAFFRLAQRELSRSQRAGSDSTLLMMDIDYFKRVNDRYGHQVGDRVLVNISATLGRELRQYDLLARLGGEEFAALIPETGTQRALEVAERLRRAVAAIVHDGDCPDLTPTVSIGVAVSHASQLELDPLISQADAALYQAKDAGRDRCILWQPPAP
jgi:diguanylate cyclase (GGDEF)-like protein/PAS domain S-box-containing protein